MMEITQEDREAADRFFAGSQLGAVGVRRLEHILAAHRKAALLEGMKLQRERDAAIADAEMKHWDSMAATVGCSVQRQQIFKGKASVADNVCQTIRSAMP